MTVPVWSPFPSFPIRVWCPFPIILLRAWCPFPSFPFGVWSPFPSIPFGLTSLLLLWSVNWKLRLSVADEGVEEGRSSLGVGMFEWGRTWKKHIRYIIMDFLSGVFTLTSTTQHCQHHSKQSIDEKNILLIQNDSNDYRFSFLINQISNKCWNINIIMFCTLCWCFLNIPLPNIKSKQRTNKKNSHINTYSMTIFGVG